MNVLYLHGLESKPTGPKMRYLKDRFLNYYAPEIDYRNPKAFEEIVDFETDFDSPYSPCSPLRVHHHHSSSIDADFADDGIDFADVVDDVRRHPSSFAVSVGPCVILQT